MVNQLHQLLQYKKMNLQSKLLFVIFYIIINNNKNITLEKVNLTRQITEAKSYLIKAKQNIMT